MHITPHWDPGRPWKEEEPSQGRREREAGERPRPITGKAAGKRMSPTDHTGAKPGTVSVVIVAFL